MIAIVDYGVGNLFSLRSSFAAVGAEAVVSGEPEELERADRLVLPGVGAFADAAEKLRRTGLGRVLLAAAERGTPLLGICLGMQLLFEESLEYGRHKGLGLISGTVRPIEEDLPEPSMYKIPHIGWNALEFGGRSDPLFRSVREGEYVYFVHSYYATDCDPYVIATTEYGGIPLTAAVRRDTVWGCQFHPEKSGNVGLSILRAFCRL